MPDELLDVVNDEDGVISQEMRSAVHRLGLLHRGVHVFLVTPQGKLVVQQRSKHKEAYPAVLDCSVSEHVKVGESYPEAAQRGLVEELGIKNVDLYPLVKFKLVYGPNDYEISVLFEGRGDPDLVKFDPQEVDSVADYSLDELETLRVTNEMAFSSWFVELINWYTGREIGMQILESYQPKRLLVSHTKSAG
jgi:isopentenyldiphosphate isomerase